ncbi:hypothetical protein NDU88_008990 [Pleurodeles waltl]|uniref:Uncharacterized protein n=1 Tax=Pleurodeles waltl TaxID=8319 RepID=A0AAV7NY77_PLEWA|nr:hypothetical protein NDU88_008990 [Pleurodeles waltl]
MVALGAQETLPKLTEITFDPPLEFQRAHRLGPRRPNGNGRSCPIIVCLLRHTQARQPLQAARTQGPFRSGTLEIRFSADFSKETAERRKAFLSLRTRLRHLDMKFGLFEPARMWITKNRESQNFYDPEDLRAFLDGLHDQSQNIEMTAQNPLDIHNLPSGVGHPVTASEPEGRFTTDPHNRLKDLDRLTKTYNDRGQVIQAVTMHTQTSDRDKCGSPLKPTAAPT